MAADNGLENLKTDCIAALRKGDEDAFEAAAVKLKEYAPDDLQFKMETLGLLACLALKQNCRRSALKALNLLSVCSLDIAPDGAAAESIFLRNLHFAAVMSARTHDKDIFAAAVSKLAVRYARTGYVKENTEAFVNLLTALMFIAADRRYTNVLPMLRWLSLRLCSNEAVGEDILLPFLREWACLAAQAARRDWQDIAAQLLNGLFYFLLKQHSFELARSLLLYVMMHMQMYAAWDGADKAFKTYAPVQNFSLLLFYRAVKLKDENRRVAIVRLLLRAWRDFIAAAARQNMQDEMELYQSWFACGQAAESAKYKKRCRLFIQLTLGYWAAQQPRTSKKQLKYLKNIFEPDLVKDKYLHLLKAVR
ncbi:MAG: hypothetical protein DBY32_05230 [Phascolarctobacterium sp.]|nr:MAG: hypothetical protein DBY32_05230 [Phascolarctobacterium sp.]